MLLDHLNDAKVKGSVPTINMMKTIDVLRSQRSGVLTSIEQYEFCYLTVLAHLKQLNNSQKK